ncbi:MAG: hypothetical protein HN348_12535 [Proteobacteria bacterium]|nr:hypothetical protein [Pseudomonadota bacterium]
MTLTQALSDPARRLLVVKDGSKLIDAEVASKRGISGMALKAGYKTIRRLRPGMIEHALHKLLPQFAPAVDPHYINAKDSGDVKGYFVKHSAEIAESMLAVTDDIATRAKNKVMLKVYKTLRGQAKGHVEAAMPGLSELISKHVD